MKLGIFTINYPRYKGDPAGSFVKELTDAYNKLGHKTFILTYYDTLFSKWTEKEIKDHNLYFCKYIYPKKYHLLGYSRTLYADIKVSFLMYILSCLLIFFSIFKLLFLIKKEKPDIMHIHWLLPNAFIMAIVNKIFKIPFVITLHGSDIFMAEKNIIFRKMAKFALKQCSFVFSCSQNFKKKVEKIYKDKKVFLIPNGVDTDIFNTKINKDAQEKIKNKYSLDNKLIIMAVGRYVYKKGFSDLIKIFKKIYDKNANMVLFLVGGGELKKEFENLIKQEKLKLNKDVFLTGEINHEELPFYISLCDIFVVPSIKDEKGNMDGLPIVLLEAMAMGKPIVASNISGIPLAIKDGENGFLISSGDINAFACKIQYLIKNPAIRSEIGKINEKEAISIFDWKKTAEKSILYITENIKEINFYEKNSSY